MTIRVFIAARRPIRAVHAGDLWLPGSATRTVLRDVASDLEVTTTERRSRLVAVALGPVPVAGALAAFLSLLWRKYLGHTGVRPVDIGIDPTTRVADALSSISFLVAVFGPFLFIRTWLDAAESVVSERRSRWLADHRAVAGAVLAAMILAVAAVLSVYADIVLVLVIGPMIAISLLAVTLDLASELPRMLRIEFVHPRRVAYATVAIVVLLISGLGAEVVLRGPEFGEKGAEGGLVTKFLGFRAQLAIVTSPARARKRLVRGERRSRYHPPEERTERYISGGHLEDLGTDPRPNDGWCGGPQPQGYRSA